MRTRLRAHAYGHSTNFQLHCMGVTHPDGIIRPNTWAALNSQINTGFYC